MVKVIKAFKGVPDGETQTRDFAEGDDVIGDLAAVAVREGWAEEEKKPSSKQKKKSDKAYADMTIDELRAFAAEKGVDISAAGNEADIIAALESAAAS